MNKYASHSRWLEARSCWRKRSRFKTEIEAREAIVRTGTKDCYECRFCGCWHLTQVLPKSTPIVQAQGF